MCATCEICASPFALSPFALCPWPRPLWPQELKAAASMSQIEAQECPLIRTKRESDALCWSKGYSAFLFCFFFFVWLSFAGNCSPRRVQDIWPTFRLPPNSIIPGA